MLFLSVMFLYADKSSNVLSILGNAVHTAGMIEPVPGSASDDDNDAGGGRPYPGDDAVEDDDLESKRRCGSFELVTH